MTPDNSSHQSYQLKPGFHPPVRTGTIGMYLFLATLTMLFASAMLGYILIRMMALHNRGIDHGSLHLPPAFWGSTVLVFVASITIQYAVREIRRERQESFRRWVLVTLGLAVAFVIVQTPAMIELLHEQRQMAAKQSLGLYGFILFLVLLHAAHVVGGIGALARTAQQAMRGVYDHEHYQPVRHMALYWHFLDAVWVIMFFTLLLLG